MDAGIFDGEFLAVAGYLDAHAGRRRCLPVAEAPPPADGAGRIVTRSRLHAELGGPNVRSSAFVLHTALPGLVTDGRVSLVGPDIGEIAPGSTVPFGQVIAVAGDGLGPGDYDVLAECAYAQDAVAGYMVRSRAGSVWGRAATDAVAGGLGFARMGAAIRALVLRRLPAVFAVEVVFVTAGDGEVADLERIAARVGEKARGLREALWASRGLDLGARGLVHCGSCAAQTVCVGVRRMARLRAQAGGGSSHGLDGREGSESDGCADFVAGVAQ